ncbi:MAG: hypothetical protein A3K19_19410 [Lentisphaerae bacterium RIFOXYB12_FULL_65_16]|nr:MAG: hypothetical protein A3K18_31405 [Lentisphaerae bacterium RIFOXYA12_64_32]OGV92030.1 MAG: hypothetical protein A3K19_19410 [Lentisphaerae bacterium RIFOXYB12_FULL_65_16]
MTELKLQCAPLTGLADHFCDTVRGRTITSVGEVRQFAGLAVESCGPIVSVGDLVTLRPRSTAAAPVLGEVVGFRDHRVLIMPLEAVEGIRRGDRVEPANEGFRVPVGRSLLGRVLDPLLRPLDGLPPPVPEAMWPLRRPPPHSVSRPRIVEPLLTGVRAVDAAIPCGRGQRMGIFAGSGVGKSSLLGMICRYSSADVNVVALIGERGKEVREFIEESLGDRGLAKTTVVVATSDRPALQRVKGAEAAMSLAEYFRDQGLNVLFVMDSVTRYAMAQREIGLAAGEPPTTKGYTPSVFALLPRLLERAGTSEKGSITAFFTVLVEGDDMDEPISDAVRSIVDGHIVLTRVLADRGHYPPVDVLASVSRVMNNVTSAEHRALARELRKMLAVYRRFEDIVTIGAYSPGSNPELDRALALKPQLDRFLCQSLEESIPWAETVAAFKRILTT